MDRREPWRWTEQQIADLRSLTETKTWDEIGAAIGCSPDVARRKAASLGIEKSILNKTEFARNMKIFRKSERIGTRATADAMGLTVDQVKAARRRVLERRRTISQNMTREKFDKFRFACFRAARNNGYAHEADDFAGWATVKMLEGSRANIDQMAVDYAREKWGRPNVDKFARTKLSMENPLTLKEDNNPETPGVALAAPRHISEGHTLFTLADRVDLKIDERLAFLLHYRDGFQQDEIALYLGVSPGRVSQILGVVRALLVRHAETLDILDESP